MGNSCNRQANKNNKYSNLRNRNDDTEGCRSRFRLFMQDKIRKGWLGPCLQGALKNAEKEAENGNRYYS